MIPRRTFLAGSAAAVACAHTKLIPTGLGATEARKRIAFLGTVVFQHSHAQHFLDRHCMGYTWGGQWQAPRFDVASVYIEQEQTQGDLAQQRIDKYKLNRVTSIADALTLGTPKLAVDGVVVFKGGQAAGDVDGLLAIDPSHPDAVHVALGSGNYTLRLTQAL